MIIGFLLFYRAVFGQTWSPVLSNVDNYVNQLYTDSKDSILYISGAFDSVNDRDANRIVGYNEDSISVLNGGLPGMHPTSLTEYRGEIYSSGYNDFLGEKIWLIGKWNGTDWERVPSDTNSFVGPGVSTSCVYNNKYYMFGDFGGTIKGGVYWDIVNWDGQKWDSLNKVYNLQNGVSSCVSFNNILFVSGVGIFLDTTYYGNIMSYNGSGFKEQSISQESGSIMTLEVFNDSLYAAAFGGTIYKYDNGKWITQYKVNGIIITLKSVGKRLYVGGEFDSIQGTQAQNIGYIEDNKGYAMGEGPDDRVVDIEEFKGNVYISGVFQNIDGKKISHIARWGSPVGVEKKTGRNNTVKLFPNPSINTLNIELNEVSSPEVIILDLLGEVVLEKSFNSVKMIQLNIDVNPGMYIIMIKTSDIVYSEKLIIK